MPPDRGEAMARLPSTYSLALRLRDAHLPPELIAECLAVEPEAVGPLLALAEAKLAAIVGSADASLPLAPDDAGKPETLGRGRGRGRPHDPVRCGRPAW